VGGLVLTPGKAVIVTVSTRKEKTMSKRNTHPAGIGKKVPMTVTITEIAHHRNGICGAPFDVLLFREGGTRKVGIVFERELYCAIFDIAKLAAGDIAFGSNSWRGDKYEEALRTRIKSHRKAFLTKFLKSTGYQE
jgi:hypothetical protein